MAKLEYSNNALNVRATFFGKVIVCYVENNDDVSFWKRLLSDTVHIEIKGSCTELDKLIRKVTSNELNALIARDRDYLDFTNKIVQHRKIFYTFGHSIENTLLCPTIVEQICNVYTREAYQELKPEQKFPHWLNHTCSSLYDLHELEISNEIHSTGIRVLGTNCQFLMKSDKSPVICSNKVSEKCSSLEQLIPEHSSSIQLSDLPTVIRGHFYASLVTQYICSLIKNINRNQDPNAKKLTTINTDTLINQAFTIWSMNFEKNPHYDLYYKNLNRIFNS